MSLRFIRVYDGKYGPMMARSQELLNACKALQAEVERLRKELHAAEFMAGWRAERIRDIRADLWDVVGGDWKAFDIETERLIKQ